MNTITTMAGLDDLARQSKNSFDTQVLVGMATCGISAGARPVLEALQEEAYNKNIQNVSIKQTGCTGFCRFEPIVEIFAPGQEKVTYTNMTADKARRVVADHLIFGKPVSEYTEEQHHSEFYGKQRRTALRNCGLIDPELIEDYIAENGYKALGTALTTMTPERVIEIITGSGLRGRGGGGFPTGRKWGIARSSEGEKKYVCCNADEGDPGAFMDRSILEGDPHVVLEAMALAGYAIGSDSGYIYVRAEYPLAIRRLEIAIAQARDHGFLGNNIFGAGFSFDIELRLGSGAFVCGEETALMASIEGKRGEPRPRPPYPAVKGLFDKPTLLNNVETYANIPQIILNGEEWFSEVGTEKSKGTKVFSLVGKINNTGLVEIPMGTTLNEIINEIGGGIPNGKKFKAAQTGGPSGGCIPASLADTPIDYENLLAIGAMMGSGGLIVMDEDTCMVDIARYFLDFTVDESCGKCSPCRIGTKRLLEMLEKIIHGKGTLADLDKMEQLCYHLKANSLCALGQTAPNPVLSTLKHFRDEYIAHVVDKKCPALVCRDLLNFGILPDKCVGCTACAKSCPAEAIVGSVKKVHGIDMSKCIGCGTCIEKCKFGAIVKL